MTAERFILDIDVRFDKSERNVDQFARKVRAAVQQANAETGKQPVRGIARSIATETSQTVANVRTQGQAAGLTSVEIDKASQAAVAQGRAQLENQIKQSKMSEARAIAARAKFEEVYTSQTGAVNKEIIALKKVEKSASASSAGSAQQKAVAESSSATSAKVEVGKQVAAEKSTTASKNKQARLAAEALAAESEAAKRIKIDAVKPRIRSVEEISAVSEVRQRNKVAAEREVARNLANDPDYIRQRAETTAARQQANLEARTLVKTDPQMAAAERLARARLRAETDRQALALARETAQSPAAIQAKAKLTAENQILATLTQKEIRRLVVSGEIPATRFQRFQAGLGLGGGGAGGGGAGGGLGATGGQFFGGGLMSVLRYSLPSLLLFGAGSKVLEGFKEAQELEKTFNLIESQYSAVFGEEGQAKARGFKEEILAIARETGVAGEEVAKVGFQFAGAFGEGVEIGGRSGQELVNSQLEAAAKAARVTGLSQDEITDPLTATSLNLGRSIEEISNIVLQLQDRFGVLAPELINFLGDIAPVAKDAGFSLEEIGTIAAITQQKSGRSGAALAEAYGRVIPAIAEAKTELVELASTNEKLNTPEFLKAIAEGNLKEIFFGLSNEFSSLNKNSQDFVINLLGGRREAASILAAFADASKVNQTIKELDSSSSDLEDRFQKLQGTIGQTLARGGEQFRQLAITLFEGGLGDAFGALVSAGTTFLKLLTEFSKIFVKFNDLTGGWAGKLLSLAAAFTLVAKGIRSVAQAEIFKNTVQSFTGLARGPAATQIAIPAGASVSGIPLASAAPAAPPVGFAAGAKNIGAALAPILALIGVTAAIDTQRKAAEEYAKVEDEFVTKLKDQNTEQLQAIVDAGDDFWTRVGAHVAGGLTAPELAAQELESRKTATVKFKADAVGQSPALIKALKDITNDELKAINEVFALNTQALSETDLDELTSGYQTALDVPSQRTDFPAFTKEDFQDPEVLKQIFADLGEEGLRGQFARQLSEAIFGAVEDDIALASALAAAEGKAGNAKAIEEALMKQEEVTKSLDDLQASYEAGDINISELLAAYDKYIQTLRTTLEGAFDPTISEELAKTLKKRAAIYSQAAIAQEAQVAEIASLSGGDTPELNKSRIDSLTALLNDPQFTTPKDRATVAKQIVGLYRELLSNQISQAESAAEAAQIATTGIEIDPLTRVELIMSQLNENNAAFKAMTDTLKISLGENSETIVRSVFTAIATNNEALLEVARADLIAKITALNAQIKNYEAIHQESRGELRQAELAGQLRASRDALFGLLVRTETGDIDDFAGASDPGKKITDAQAAQEKQKSKEDEVAKEAEALRKARFEVLKAMAGDDPIALAKIEAAIAADDLRLAKTPPEKAQALAAKIRTDNALRKAYEQQAVEEFNARIEVAKALAEGDPIKLAQLDIFAAAAEFNRATTDAERIRALANRIRAEQSAKDAIFDVVKSQIDLAKALAESVQDSVKAAEIAYFEAALELNKVIQEHPEDQAARNRAEAQVIATRTAVSDAKISKQLEDYRFLFDMEQVTKEQYINYLIALRATLDPETQQQQFRDISRTIKQLQGDLGKDLQFNLPSSLTLPTLYEVRRLDQSVGPTGAQIGYQDNRNVTVSLYITNGMTEQQAVDLLTNAMGSNNRFGYSTRRY